MAAIRSLLLIGIAAGLICCLPHGVRAEQPEVDFVRDVLPIFKAHCYQCHGPESQQSNYRLDVKQAALSEADYGEPIIVPGNTDEGLLLGFITGENDHGMVMPPEKDGRRLNEQEIATIRNWIAAGAPWPEELAGDPDKITTDHWSFQPVERPTVPQIAGDWPTNDVDRFILAKLREADLTPSQRADRVTLIRRLYLDMLGLPPTPAEIDAFVHDERSDAWPLLVEQVLKSPHYGERWGRHWLDVVRFAESNGFETNHERPNAYHFRDYVIRAFNDDKPYNEFVFEQLAGDSVGEHAATGFLVGGTKDNVGSPDINLQLMQREDELADIVGTTSTAFLGLTMACARCHNHKFDPLLQKDYYSMVAVFRGVAHGERTAPGPNQEEALAKADKLQQRVAALEAKLAEIEPLAHSGRTMVLDDAQVTNWDEPRAGIIQLQAPAGKGVVAQGDQRGQFNYSGDAGILPHLGGAEYTWWHNAADELVAGYRPRAAGRFHVWLSWGAGHETHAANAEYLLDLDGDLATSDDQTVIARVDQRRFFDQSQPKQPPGSPLWSGFYSAGVHELRESSLILLRGGDAGTAVTADAIVLQESMANRAESPQPVFRQPVNSRENHERLAPTLAQYIRFTVNATNSAEPCIDELEVWASAADGTRRNVARLADTVVRSSGDYVGSPLHELEHINDGKYGNSQSWISNESGRGWVQLELAEPAMIDKFVWGRDREGQFVDRTATDYAIEVALKPDEWQPVAGSGDRVAPHYAAPQAVGFRLSQVRDELDADIIGDLASLDTLRNELRDLRNSANVTMYAGNFSTPPLTHRLYRGDPMAKREVVSPDIPTVAGTLELGPESPEQQRRIELANWITSKENPLTARVMVNRIWHFHFGTGIVDTPSDFGGNGTKPTHPELLDWLAAEFTDADWSIKHIHRLILLSSTYQQSGEPNAAARKVDASCRLLWRFPPRRLEAEAIRDGILAVSGQLDKQMYGPGFMFYEPNSNYARNWIAKDDFGPAEFRRMIYGMKIRMEQDSVFGAFDCPDGGQVTPKRSSSTTALQALNLLNSPFLLQQADYLAQRLAQEAGANPEQQVRRGFQLATGREPTAEELAASVDLIEQYELKDFCRALFNVNEFLFIP